MSRRPFESFLRATPSGCIEWTGVTAKSNGRDSHRYGRVTIGDRKFLAHRVAFERASGPIPAGMLVLHRCDNTRCCNPAHLFLGTHADNMADMRAKGRSRRCANDKPARGESHGFAKLTEHAVAEIRKARAGGVTTVELGRLYGVHHSVISRVARGVTWRHL